MYNKLELNLGITKSNNGRSKRNGTPRKPSRPAVHANVKTPPRPSPRTTKIDSLSAASSPNHNTLSYKGLLNSPQFNSTTGTNFDLTRFSSFDSSLFPNTYESIGKVSPTWNETMNETRREEKIIKGMRDSVLRGNDYPLLINPLARTKSSTFSTSNKAHPASARIAGNYSQHLEVLHLRRDENLVTEGVKQLTLQASDLAENPLISSYNTKILTIGLPRATARPNAGPISAPEVDFPLSPRKKTKLVYEYISQDTNSPQKERKEANEKLVDPRTKFLYNLRPEVSTNATGDGRVHAFHTTNIELERLLNSSTRNTSPLKLNVNQVSSLDQKPRYRKKRDTEACEITQTISLIGVHKNQNRYDDRRSMNTNNRATSFLDQSSLRPGLKEAMLREDLDNAEERYWYYVTEMVPDEMIAPMNYILVNNIVTFVGKALLPSGIAFLSHLDTDSYLANWSNVSNSIKLLPRVRKGIHLLLGHKNQDKVVDPVPRPQPSQHLRVLNFQLSIIRLFARVWADVDTKSKQLFVDVSHIENQRKILQKQSHLLTEDEEDSILKQIDDYEEQIDCLYLSKQSAKMIRKICKTIGVVTEDRLAFLREDINELRLSLENHVTRDKDNDTNDSFYTGDQDKTSSKKATTDDTTLNIIKDVSTEVLEMHANKMQENLLRQSFDSFKRVWVQEMDTCLKGIDMKLYESSYETLLQSKLMESRKVETFQYPKLTLKSRLKFNRARLALLKLVHETLQNETEKYKLRLKKNENMHSTKTVTKTVAIEGKGSIFNTTTKTNEIDTLSAKNFNTRLVLETIYEMTKSVEKKIKNLLKTEKSKVWDELLEESAQLYILSTSQATVDYAMLHPVERKRLRLLKRPNDLEEVQWGWGVSRYVDPPTEQVHNAVKYARTEIAEHPRGASINNLLIADIIDLWQQFSHLRVVDVPQTDLEAQERRANPVTIQDFVIKQKKVANSVKDILKYQWYPAAVDIVLQASKNKVFEGVPSEVLKTFFNSLASVMSTQIQSIILESIKTLLKYFQRYVDDTVPNLQEDVLKSKKCNDKNTYTKLSVAACKPAFLVELCVDFERKVMCFHGTGNALLEDLIQQISNLYNFLVSAVGRFKRIEKLDIKEFKDLGRNDVTFLQSPEYISHVEMNAHDIINWKKCIMEIVDKNVIRAKNSLMNYEKLNYLIHDASKVEKFCTEGTEQHPISEFQENISKYRRAAVSITNNKPLFMYRGMFAISCDKLNKALVDRSYKFVDRFMQSVADSNKSRNRSVAKRFDAVRLEAEKSPNTSDELTGLEKYFDKLISRGGELERLKQSGRELTAQVNFLWKNAIPLQGSFVLPYTVLKPMGDTIKWLRKIDSILMAARGSLRVERDRFETRLKRRKEGLLKRLGVLETRISTFVDIINLDKRLQGMVDDIDDIDRELLLEDRNIAEINTEEVTLGLPATKFAKLKEIKESLSPFSKLWGVAHEWRKAYKAWTTGIVFELDAEEIEKHVRQMNRTCMKVNVVLEEIAPKTIEVLEQVKSEIDEFKMHLPIISIMSNKGMRERHWEQVSDSINRPMVPDRISNLFSERISSCQKYIEKLLIISDNASKEWAVEKLLATMKNEWAPLVYTYVTEYRETGAAIVRGESVDSVQELLDEQIIKTQTLTNLPQAKVFIEEVNSWLFFLETSQSIIDVWLSVQSSWMYLYPVFGSDDIKRALETESLAFLQVDDEWRRLMQRAVLKPQCLKVHEIPKLLERLEKMSTMLEDIHAGLKRYLESKRLGFPRFFFLSDEELLTILAETKDPKRVNSHLRKLFDGVDIVSFQGDDTDLEIISVKSSKKEEVMLVEPVDPLAFGSGACEKWLKILEKMVWKSIRAEVQIAFEQYDENKREEWLLNRAAQVAINVNQAMWTRESEFSLRTKGKIGLEEFSAKMEKQQNAIVALVRGELSKVARSTLGALLVIDVHARDVINNLISEGVDSTEDFLWKSQLRYYWENNDFQAKIMHCVKAYGYEYIGNKGRLVITPLTDRCYRTLMGALYLQYGGAPEGPAGTGKTETVKDLSKAMAIYCIVWNCSDGLDYLAMAKFFKGLAACGAWSCFDEFNRIVVEVLSVIAQQISTIQKAIAAKETKFNFEGTRLDLNWNAAVFITMNPGYAGRAELPDNLKALFRPVAMMVPDYTMIAEIVLYSFGFSDAAPLSVKIVATYKLCSELLSSQGHYDYGMRAVKSVLTAAGNLKRKYPNGDEHELVLTAINEINLPKFLFYDLPLFKGITRDLFPGTESPDDRSDAFMTALNLACVEFNVKPTEEFVDKVIQLRKMILVRHGLMLVGEPFGGKTKCWQVLQSILCRLCELKQLPCDLNNEHELHTDVHVINPKAITAGELYGESDKVSGEWSDGVLAKTYRACSSARDEHRKWVLFDGPVDAVWIENMNTVLDDNKKLCLVSGEMLNMSSYMNMLFETLNLNEASPATVSRCGMVYLNAPTFDANNWMCHVECWMNSLPSMFSGNENVKKIIEKLYNWAIPCLNKIRLDLIKLFLMPISEMMLLHSLNTVFESFLFNLLPENYRKSDKIPVDEDEENANIFDIDKLNEIDTESMLQSLFILACTWSFGSPLNQEGREMFNEMWRNFVTDGSSHAEGVKYVESKIKVKILSSFPPKGSVFDYSVAFNDQFKVKWATWSSLLDSNYSIDSSLAFNQIQVPTADTMCSSYLMERLVSIHAQPLIVGSTGCGKTIAASKFINDFIMPKTIPVVGKAQKAAYGVDRVQFSAHTGTASLFSFVTSMLAFKKKQKAYAPKSSDNFLVLIDDLNMPAKETYGAQPPLELLRQAIDQKGWYNLQTKELVSIKGLQIMGAMGVPGGGRNKLPSRLQRHFQVIGILPPEKNTINVIYKNIMQWHFARGKYASALSGMIDITIDATHFIYSSAHSKLRPTPKKSHYVFTLCDIKRVIQGIMLTKTGQLPDGKELTQKYTRLWTHEVSRVFFDKCTELQDREWFCEILRSTLQKYFKANLNEMFAHLDLDGDGNIDSEELVRGHLYGVFGKKGCKKVYDEMLDLKLAKEACEVFLNEYNSMSKTPMDLVLFKFAIEHIARIARIIMIPGGHGLLVGIGGSGRRSLCRLAAHVIGAEVVQFDIGGGYTRGDWKDNLKDLLIKVGSMPPDDSDEYILLMADTQIIEESFINDIGSILSSGDVPGLFASNEKGMLLEKVRAAIRAAGMEVDNDAAVYSFFVQQIKQHLHVVLAMSPVGSDFRQRLRQIPALISCCTIDWFSQWPKDALEAVSQKLLSKVDLEPEVKMNAALICQEFFSDISDISQRFLEETRRPQYVVPISYLELLILYDKLLSKKRKEVSMEQQRYETGVAQLISAEESVAIMQEKLELLKPVLKQSSEDTSKMMEMVKTETEFAEKIREGVIKEEAAAQVKADTASSIKAECEAELAKAMPAMNNAIAALKSLKPSDITELKSMSRPPAGVRLIAEVLCHMFFLKPIKKPDPKDPSKKIEDYWESGKKNLLSNTDFLSRLFNYDKDNIPAKLIKKVTPYLSRDDFQASAMKKASIAAYGISEWVRAMVDYDVAAKIVGPKKAAMEKATAEFEEIMIGVREKQQELAGLDKKLKELGVKLSDNKKKKENLEAEVLKTGQKIERAKSLISGLGSEKSRWTNAAEELGLQLNGLVGDVLISTAVVAFLGVFSAPYRKEIMTKWSNRLHELNVPRSDIGEKVVMSTLSDPVTIRQWNVQGLPQDNFSIENAVIASNTSRWPLFIDPQVQANKWIRNLENDNGLQVLVLNDENYIRSLKNAIRFGTPILLENVGETMDMALDPLLLKQIFRKGATDYINLGNEVLEYSPTFRFYLTTVLANPHYSPETAVKVTLINFMVTQDGLEEQILADTVAQEKPELEKEKNRLIVEGAENTRRLKELEDRILRVLSSSGSSILEDESAVEVLTSSKTLSQEIKEKQVIAKKTEMQIDAARKQYIPVSRCATSAFMCITELSNIDPMYQYSLSWFKQLFVQAILSSRDDRSITLPSNDNGISDENLPDVVTAHIPDNQQPCALVEQISASGIAKGETAIRVMTLNKFFMSLFYRNICRSLFEKDKLTFSFLITIKLMQCADPARAHKIQQYIRFLGTGGSGDKSATENPCKDWMPQLSWNQLQSLSLLNNGEIKHITHKFRTGSKAWKSFYNSSEPHNIRLPGDWGATPLSTIQRLCLIRCLRRDAVVPTICQLIEEQMNKTYMEPPAFDLHSAFKDSSNTTPIVFILSEGSNPMAPISSLGEKSNEIITSVSLGQGQAPKAEKLLAQGMVKGNWVVLENCHLYPTWMPSLDRIFDQLQRNDSVNQNFRLWLTSKPSSAFPISILQASVKLTKEAPKGLRANLLGSYVSDAIADPSFFQPEYNAAAFQKLLFGLCFFHAITQERRDFGPIGWTNPYGFSESDLKISLKQLHQTLNVNLSEYDDEDDESKSISNDILKKKIGWKALQYNIGQCNYGGRVTDDFDRKYLMTSLVQFITGDILQDGFALSESGNYCAPTESTYEETIAYIESLPQSVDAEVFGMHGNAKVTKMQRDAVSMLETVLVTQPRVNTGSNTLPPEKIVAGYAISILEKIPESAVYKVEQIRKKYPAVYGESMNSVLCQELERFNRLLIVIRESCVKVHRAAEGLEVIDDELERMIETMYNGKLPSIWLANSYPSLMPLQSYIEDLVKRLFFFNAWIQNGIPTIFWLPSFYFTHAFLTGARQNFSRKNKFAVDEVGFEFEQLKKDDNRVKTPPAFGVYIYGLYLEGAKWSNNNMILVESDPRVLYTEAPSMWLKPTHRDQEKAKISANIYLYHAPLYKTSERRGILATTGHSSNYIMPITLPSKLKKEHWIKRGVALLATLDN